MNLADPSWELIDPTPNVHGLFVQFDKTFFWTKLESVIVKWSKRMYSCAGTCTYHPRTRGCIITLSEPLLKLRPRKDLVETLLHEMIHAYLFITGGDRDRDGHGPMFKSHMHRINQKTNLNISIYHDFHDEVKLYKTHWWRCSGPCQQRQPFFGIIKRSSNRAPGPNDFWWEDHGRTCNGTFIKIKEPEKKTKGKESKKATRIPINDISKYLINSSNTLSNVPSTQSKIGSNIKTISNINNSSKGNKTKSNETATVVVSNNNKINTIKGTDENKNIILWKGDGYKINESNKTNSLGNKNVNDIVKSVWANKQINSNNTTTNKTNKNKRRITDITQQSPPSKITKIDDYFNKSITSRPTIALDTATAILQDLYGQDLKLYQNEETNSKIIAVQNSNSNIVGCPICKEVVKNCDINRHLDECLNKKEIKKITNNEIDLNDTFGILKSDTYKKNDVKEPKPSTSRELIELKTECDIIDLTESNVKLKCPCCNETVAKSIDEHLDECLSIMNDQSTVPDEGNSIRTEAITSDDDDYETVDESTTFNETGTKFPCPCCLNMVEQDEMNSHLDRCLKTN